MVGRGPTTGAERHGAASQRWESKRWRARILRITIAVTPVVLAMSLGWMAGRVIPPERLGMNRWIWTAILLVSTTVVVAGLRRALRRLAPLAALMELTLVFPDQAPSRSKAVLRKSSSRALLRKLEEGKANGDDSLEVLHGDYLVQLLQEVNDHDRLTRGHSERVRAYAEMLGEELGLGQDDMNKLRWSALLHDAGKLAVPAEILNKDGRPTEEEWAILSGHPAAGGRMLQPLAGWLGDWVHAADQHHCRWDGKGYPHDLAGEDIALSGRIVAVADAYDVMTSARSYKKPLSHEVARQELTDCAGSQFDPAIVRAFLNVSLGRLQAVVGPFAGLAHLLTLPQVRVPVLSSVGGATGPVVTALAAVGVVSLGAPTPEPVPDDLALVETVADVSVVDRTVDVVEDEPMVFSVRGEGGVGPLTFRLDAPAHGRLSPAAGTGRDDGRGGWELWTTYLPDADYAGPDEFTFEACDADDRCRAASVRLAVEAVNDRPDANADRAVVEAGQSVPIDVLANDIDVEGDWLEVVELTRPEHGLAVIAEGLVVYLPDTGFVGQDRFDYVVADSGGARSIATVEIEVTRTPAAPAQPEPEPDMEPLATPTPIPEPVEPATDLAPVAQADQATTDEDVAVVIDVLANDTDPEGEPISVSAVGVAGRGDATIEGGMVRYQPDPDSNGNDTFLYTVSDGVNPPVAALVEVVVRPVNDGPTVSVADATLAETVAVGSSVTTAVAADVDGDLLDYRIVSGDPTGRFDIDALGQVTVVAPLDHETTTGFSLDIEVSDGTVATTATSLVTVADVNEAPVAGDDGGIGFATVEDTLFTTASILANDSDPEAAVDPVWVTVTAGPANGTLLDNGDGTFDYEPDPEWSGTDQFTYTVTDDGAIQSGTATVTIVVDPVNDAPVATNPGAQTGAVGSPFSLQIVASDVELDGLAYATSGLPSGLAINGTGLISGTPGAATEGLHSVTVTVTDDGSPAESDAVTFALDLALHEVATEAGDIVLNEVMYNTFSATAPEQFVELYNSSGAAVDLAGWVLADANLKADGAEDLAFTVPATDHWGSPSTLAAGDRAVVWVVYDGANLPPLLNSGSGLEYVVNSAGLKLGSAGDDVWLLDPTTRIVDYMAYGAGADVGTPPDGALGLWDASDQASLLTGAAASIVLTPNGVDGDTSSCWEATGSDEANGRCPGAITTVDSDTMGALVTSVGGHNHVAADVGGPYAIDEGAAVALDGSGSTMAVSYAWDLDNDGSYDDAAGVSPTVAWSTLASLGLGDDGVYPVGLQVSPGLHTSATTLTISNVVPVLSTTGLATVTDGGVYTLNLAATDPGDDTITGWTINWGDGTIETIAGNPSSVTHTYNGAGFTFNVLASATDEDGTHQQNDLLVPSYDGDEMFRFAAGTGAFLQRFAVNDDPIEPLIGPDGRLYSSAEVSADVLRYDAATGAFVDTFVASGTGGLGEAEGMAFGPDGDLFVADWSTDRVLRFDGTTGASISAFATTGLDGAYDVLFGPDLDLYVTNFTGNEVMRYDGTTGALVSTFVSADSGGLTDPEQATFGPDGHLYVSSFGTDEVLRYDGTTGTFIDVFVAAGGVGGLDDPSGLAFGPDGNLYVADLADAVVLRFNGTTGAYIDEFVAPGEGGLTQPALLTFVPELQVTVVP